MQNKWRRRRWWCLVVTGCSADGWIHVPRDTLQYLQHGSSKQLRSWFHNISVKKLTSWLWRPKCKILRYGAKGASERLVEHSSFNSAWIAVRHRSRCDHILLYTGGVKKLTATGSWVILECSLYLVCFTRGWQIIKHDTHMQCWLTVEWYSNISRN